MDINMPDMNGYEATREIKKLKPDIPVVAQTAYSISGDREKILDSGFDDYISKPIKKEDLYNLIERFTIK
jgi:FOG: CheY-like receiver